MSLRFDSSELQNRLSLFEERLNVALRVYADTSARNLEGYAKEHRPWTDRTNRARLGLSGYVTEIENGYRIIIAHTVDYGVWLEYAHEKRFAILEPTVRLQGPEVIRGMENLLNMVRM